MTRKNDGIVIDVAVLSQGWPPYKARINKIALKTLDASGYLKKQKKRPIEISVALADDEFVRSLNFRFRGKDKATNVLAFPHKRDKYEESIALGDVVLAYETVKKEARAQKKKFNDHAMHLIIHGILHLLGYDHMNARQANKMEALETRILKSFGVKNPYAYNLLETDLHG